MAKTRFVLLAIPLLLLGALAGEGAGTVAQPAQAAEGDGRGLAARYFDDRGLERLALGRTDPRITSAGAQAPRAGASARRPSRARWTGRVEISRAGTYRFYTRASDGVRLWVNGKRVVDHWPVDRQAGDPRTEALASEPPGSTPPPPPLRLRAPPPSPQSSEGRDNDGDGRSDHPADPGCEPAPRLQPVCDRARHEPARRHGQHLLRPPRARLLPRGRRRARQRPGGEPRDEDEATAGSPASAPPTPRRRPSGSRPRQRGGRVGVERTSFVNFQPTSRRAASHARRARSTTTSRTTSRSTPATSPPRCAS